MTARERHPIAYQTGYVIRQLEALEIRPYTDAQTGLADIICMAEARGHQEIAEHLGRGLDVPQPPADMLDEDQSDWWLAFYAGRRDARLADEVAR